MEKPARTTCFCTIAIDTTVTTTATPPIMSLCPDQEGWGPSLPGRIDFSRCFMDGVLLNVSSAYLLLLGASQIWLLRRRTRLPIAYDWQYWFKMAAVYMVEAASIGLLVLRVLNSPAPTNDILVGAALLQTLAVGMCMAIHHLEQARCRVANGPTLFYWLALALLGAVKLGSLIAHDAMHYDIVYFCLFAIQYFFSILVFVLAALVPKAQSEYDVLLKDERCPVEDANVFSRLTFSWMTPMMRLGYKQYLQAENLWTTRREDTSAVANERFESYWRKQLLKKKPSLWIVLAQAYGKPYLMAALFKVVQDCLAFVQPQLLRRLINFVSSYSTDAPEPAIKGVAIAMSMFLVSVLQTAVLHQYFQRAFETGMRIKAGVISTIYKKALRLSNEGRVEKSTGDIVNLMSVDTQRLQDLTQFLNTVWSAPLQITLCLLSLYNLMGLSMLGGVVVMMLMIPLNTVIAKVSKKLQLRQMKNKDQRTRLMNEILSNIKSIKLYSWEVPYLEKLNHVRNELELKTLRKIGLVSAIANFSWGCAPFFVSCSTFAIFGATSGKPLTTDIVFPALTLFNLLTFPLAVLPNVITSIIQAAVSIERLTDYLTSDELQNDAVRKEPAATRIGQETVRVENASFAWTKSDATAVLRNLNFTARKAELACIVGRVGTGKSSFMQALLGDLHRKSGSVTVRGKIAYVAQQPWVMNASVKQNIIFGHRYDEGFYKRTLDACAMTEDLSILPDGDETEVGEKGISLSGGQKARLSLARAVYSRADVLLLDDPLSAVDQHVGRHLIDKVLGPKGLLATKTRILATNAITVLSAADSITMIRDHSFVESGTYEEVMAARSDLFNLISEFGKKTTAGEEGSEGSETLVETDGTSSGVSDEDGAQSSRKYSTVTVRRASVASFRHPGGKVVDEERQGPKRRTTQAKEFQERGKVKWDVYKEYARASNLPVVFIFLAIMLGANGATVAGNFWLKHWSEENTKVDGNPNFGRNVLIYFALGIGGSTLVVIYTVILYMYCAIQSAKKLHMNMAAAVFRAPMQFFETTPLGRILNRFSNDIYRIDEVLSRTFNMFFSNSAKVLFTLVVITISTPPFLIIIIPLSCAYLWYQQYYLRTSRELKRLESTTRSPIYSHFQESLGGVSTVRAYGQQDRFRLENEWRVDLNLRAYFPSISANRWLAVRLEFLGSIIILTAAMLAIYDVVKSHSMSAGMVGLAMSYALQITQALNWIVRQTVEVETNIVSVERVLEYSRIKSEAPEVIADHRPAASWPANGRVVFDNYSTRYRPELDLVLKGINLDIKSQEKIGIVGRTGAGKSSLTLALFRIIEAAEGNISIDENNTSLLGLRDLRQRLAIIPQDSQAFEGTIRDNLDPSHSRDDTDLWNVLELSSLRNHIKSMEGGLDAKVYEGGSNLSSGQRQLMCLARALLTPSRVLVLDEATAAVDVQTDQIIQSTIRQEFASRTILTIAHRINTIMDSDRIVVLSAGKVTEFDTPANLLANEGSMFASLVKESGIQHTPSSSKPSSATPSIKGKRD